ncbi:transcriptional regulator family: Fungal Specific TF [Paecilomyces variotii]|nr:transcriptional regulator family: Fungal Specific TF [Paecilomyces variotii]KAJ9311673.1 transcriptional regulator family: Fungal Specific TF [Paecilomyces variotii]
MSSSTSLSYAGAYGSFSTVPNGALSDRAPQSQTSGLDTLAEGSQYALEQLQLSREAHAKPKDQLYAESCNGFKASFQRDSLSEARSAIRKNSSSTPVRRRISRACDQCNQLRTKCDGHSPCAHCIEFGLTCEYARERKKRGKASKKDLARAAAAATAAPSSNGNDSASSANGQSPADKRSPSEVNNRSGIAFDSSRDSAQPRTSHARQQSMTGMTTISPSQQQQQQELVSGLDALPMNGFGSLQEVDQQGMGVADFRSLQMLQSSNANHRSPSSLLPPPGFNSGYGEAAFSLIGHPEQNVASTNRFRFAASAGNASAPFIGLTPPAQSPGWLPLPSPSPANLSSFTLPPVPSTLRYPVLQPILPHIASIIPQSLACDLLDLYFTSSSSSHLCPQSPYVVGYVFRKQSFLHPTKPRVCSPSLLASMLWVAAQTSDAAFLTSPPSARGRVCQKLLELTVGLLRPLIHGPAPGEASPNYAANMVINGVALGGFGVSMDQLGAESSATGATDDVATYIHLATVVSASEYKGASIRWWAAAWSLARELKLGRELPPNMSQVSQDGERDRDTKGDIGKRHPPMPLSNGMGNSNIEFSEEEREERRRIWWLLYVMDRHLALCYNRPLSLLDRECEGLLQPMNDDLWQAGDFSNAGYRRVGPSFECTGHSMFGYFLPLMTILGEIVDLHHARNHPMSFRSGREWDAQVAEITRQLDVYGQSLKDFETRQMHDEPMVEGTRLDHLSPSVRSSDSRMTESKVQTEIVVAYGTHIMHVLHILLAGKWDPIALLDDNDLWISSDEFVAAMGHAVNAAEAADRILKKDPDLSYMPFFFGIYLLQGSFLLLLTADKLQTDASSDVVRACEIIVRAHEACVVTLNTEYQRNFRKVMRSALAQVHGRVPEDLGEQQRRRREVLALYRWTGDGSGLAL